MTYQEKYFKIINTGSKDKPEIGYYERHHIVPKSICPLLKNSKGNLIYLTAKNHFLAHYYIYHWFKDELHEKKWSRSMCFALIKMKRQLMKSDDIEKLSDLYQEVRKDLSESMKVENCGVKNPMFGKHLTVNARKKISEAQKGNKSRIGKHHSEESKRKIGLKSKGNKYHLGKHHSEEAKRKMRRPKTEIEKQHMRESKPKTPVVQYTIGLEYVAKYESTREAERQTNIGHCKIISCCKGKRKSAGGFIWRYE